MPKTVGSSDEVNISNEKLEDVFRNLESKEFKVRNETIKMLGNLKNAKAREKLLELIENPTMDNRLRISAIDSIGKNLSNNSKDNKLFLKDKFIKIFRNKTKSFN